MSSASSARALPVFLEKDRAEVRTAELGASLARVLVAGSLLAAPLAFGAVEAWAWTSLAAVALAALLLWAATGLRQRELRITWSPLYAPLGLFLLLGCVQLLAGSPLDPPGAREALVKLATCVIFFFLAGQLAIPLRGLGLAVTVYGFALGLFALLQFFSSDGLIYWLVKPQTGGWIFGPYVNRNHYAGLMVMLIPVAAAYAFSGRRAVASRAALGFAVLIATVSLLLSGSRGGFVSLLAEIVLLSGVLLLVPGNRAHRGRAGAAAAGAFLFAAALFWWVDPGDISRRLATLRHAAQSAVTLDVTFGQRAQVTRDTLRIVKDYPWFGTGLGSFQTIYPGYRSFPSDLLWDHAHNDYVEALAETGLPGGALILAAVGVFLRLAFRDLRARLRRQAGWIELGAALGCCGLLVHSFVDFNLHIPANAAVFAALAAVAVSHS